MKLRKKLSKYYHNQTNVPADTYLILMVHGIFLESFFSWKKNVLVSITLLCLVT